MNVTITGATGFLGSRLVEELLAAGQRVHVLGRRRSTQLPASVAFSTWDAASEPPAESLAGAHAVIHLAGEPVAQRWTPAAKARIRRSRVEGTRLLVNAISRQSPRPAVLACASAIGIYGSRGDEILKATAAMILDNIREGDLAVRYGGEEILIVVPSDMYTSIILAERLRFAQETRVLARGGMEDVRKVGQEGGEPCASLSVGVADIGGVLDLQKAVEKADRALYAAKKTRNSVMFVEKDGGAFTSYAEYRRRAAPGAGATPPRGTPQRSAPGKTGQAP